MNALPQEYALIESFACGLPRSASQLNGIFESDAELLRLTSGDRILAVTTDTIVEEIATGLYTDPFQIGWMTVVVNASDLAAVGAEPLGCVVTITLPADLPSDVREGIRRGIAAASEATGLPVLGGDTNHGPALQTGGTAFGLVPECSIVTRRGCTAGDVLVASGPLGFGNAYAFARLSGHPLAPSLGFLPLPRLDRRTLLRSVATACIDTSDGLIGSLDQLLRVNGLGCHLTASLEDVLHPQALATSAAAGIPPWLMLAGPHGEFELLFTIPAPVLPTFLGRAAESGWSPIVLGTLEHEPGLRASMAGRDVEYDTLAIRNLTLDPDANLERLIAGLLDSVRVTSLEVDHVNAR